MEKQDLQDYVRQVLDLPPSYKFTPTPYTEMLKLLETDEGKELAKRMLLQKLFDFLTQPS